MKERNNQTEIKKYVSYTLCMQLKMNAKSVNLLTSIYHDNKIFVISTDGGLYKMMTHRDTFTTLMSFFGLIFQT